MTAGLLLALSSAVVAGSALAAPPDTQGAPEPPHTLSAARPDLAPLQSGLDYHSFANIEQFRVTHIELALRVDFHNKVLFGEAGAAAGEPGDAAGGA